MTLQNTWIKLHVHSWFQIPEDMSVMDNGLIEKWVSHRRIENTYLVMENYFTLPKKSSRGIQLEEWLTWKYNVTHQLMKINSYAQM